MLNTIAVSGGAGVSLRLATDEEIAADETVADLAARTREGTWLAFRPAERLTADTPVRSSPLGPARPRPKDR